MKISVSVFEAETKVEKKEYAPKFVRDLSDRKTTAGKSVTLECEVDAVPKADVKWFKDGIALRVTPNVYTEYNAENGNARLVIHEATQADAGAYRCVASNTIGSANTMGKITVEGMP